MRCISKRIYSISLLAVSLCIILTGCSGAAYDIPYDPDTTIVPYTFNSNIKEASCDGFASYLCVAKDDINPGDISLNSIESCALFDLNNKNTLISKNANMRLNPASLTKVMTAMIALEYGNPDDLLTASSNVMITENGAQLAKLKEGDRMTLDQALNCLLLYSANDCGVMIAEYVSGSVDAFADVMNAKAKSLGATNTHFTNPHGLTDENHYTTAYDLYLIFNEAIKDQRFLNIISKSEYSCIYKDRDGKEKKFECTNTNGYMTGDKAAPANVTVIGGKTGTTDAAGACLILLSYGSDNTPYISVILHDNDQDMLYSDMSLILNDIP